MRFEPKIKASMDLESFVAKDHFLRRIDSILDLSFVLELRAPVMPTDTESKPSSEFLWR